MQKLLYVEAKNQEGFEKMNQYLDDGWVVIDLQCECPGKGGNMMGIVLIEKKQDI
jgi:hypothetical protein